jgi:hypothetical protein
MKWSGSGPADLGLVRWSLSESVVLGSVRWSGSGLTVLGLFRWLGIELTVLGWGNGEILGRESGEVLGWGSGSGLAILRWESGSGLKRRSEHTNHMFLMNYHGDNSVKSISLLLYLPNLQKLLLLSQSNGLGSLYAVRIYQEFKNPRYSRILSQLKLVT